MKRILISFVIVVALAFVPAAMLHAQQQGASAALQQSMQRMHADMMKLKITGDMDHDFAAMMIVHHQGAIRMARIELADGRDAGLRKMARDTIQGQGLEVAALQSWLKEHPSVNRSRASEGLRQSMQRMHMHMAAMKMRGNADRDFAAMMIMHHQGAIAMARVEQGAGREVDMLEMARSTILTQGREVAQMQEWLRARPGGQATGPD